MIRTSILLATLCATSVAAAQSRHLRGACGTGPADLDVLRANVAAAKARSLSARTADVHYVPVRFKLFGRSDSSGVVPVNNLLDLLEAVNADFAPLGIQFFLRDDGTGGAPWDVFYDDELYLNSSDQTETLARIRASDAITVYVPDDATPPGSDGLGVTLGYYSGRASGDYLVFKRSEISDNASTASHEFGHYFGLPHTFNGWECTSWEGEATTDEINPVVSPVDTAFTPCTRGNRNVELVTRGDGANCEEAGDLFCDTPADYNFGFSYAGCDYVGSVVDANGDTLDPDESNFMGYFLGCHPYRFSEGQSAAIRADLVSSGRSSLRAGPGPASIDSVAGEVRFLAPARDSATSPFGDILELEWEPVAGAQYYLAQISTRAEFTRGVQEVVIPASQTSYVFAGIRPNRAYYYRVRPFGQVETGRVPSRRLVTTGDRLSGVGEPGPEAAASMTLFPNPAVVGGGVSLRLAGAAPGDAVATVRDLTGRVRARERLSVSAVSGSFALPSTRELPPGSYVLTLANERGASSRRFVVE